MDLRQLGYFHTVAQTQHITRSAEQLHIAQPALTQSIRRLEHELGCRLIEPDGRNIRLTPEGRYVDDHAARILEEADLMVQGLRGFSEQESRTVRLDIRAASGVVVDAIDAYRRLYPEALFELRQHESPTQPDISITALAPGADIVRTTGGRPFVATFEERILLALPKDAGAALGLADDARSISLAAVADEPFLCLARSVRFRQICDELCQRIGFEPVVGCESDNPSIIKRMVALGLGISFWPEKSWGSLDEMHTRVLAIEEPGFARMVAIQAPHGKDRPEAHRFEEFLIARLSEVIEPARQPMRKPATRNPTAAAPRQTT